MTLDLNLQALLPEIFVAAVTAALTLLEIFLPGWSRRNVNRLNFLGLGLVAISLLSVWGRQETAFGGSFALDPFSLFFKFLFLGSAAVVLVMKKNERAPCQPPLDPPGPEFHLLLWSALLGLFFLVSAKDFLLFFISLELLTLSLYILAAYTKKDPRSVEAGLKYLILGSLASAFLLYGISLIYADLGTLSFDALGARLREGGEVSWIFLAGSLLVISALGFKVAAVPFQAWVPDVYEGAPTPVVAFLSVASKSAGFAALLRILFGVLGPLEAERQALFPLFAALTLLYGNLGALVQTKMKRLLGFSSIGHAGFLLVALASHDVLGSEALLYYLIAYAVTNLAAFLVVSIVEISEGETLEAYRGLYQRSPVLAAGLFLAFLSLAGVPPLGGFFAKFLVLLAAAKSHLFWLVFLGAVNVAVSLYYYLNVIRLVYFEKPVTESPVALSLPSRCLLIGLMAAIVIVGLWQAPFLSLASLASSSLF
ncbi:MAG: NADH-quinone oxidoreductase subunit N [Candidatus Omnitrophica bacterium]|nr:NADH-quinone oxidoreductase subunit N [Candidatus Omnitrophota bacterium]